MANILDHRFRSSKADGADPSQIQPSAWNDGHAFTGGADGNTLVRDTSDPAYGAKWAPHGQWIDVPFNPSGFHGSGGMTWQVAGVDLLAYALNGKTCFVSWFIQNTTIGGTADAVLYFDLPAPVTALTSAEVAVCCIHAGGVWQPGFAFTLGGSPRVQIGTLGAATLLPLGPFSTQGQIFFRVA